METKLASERLQKSSETNVPYKITINRDGAMAMWDGEIQLEQGVWHRLRGGTVYEVDANTVDDAALSAFDRELETLNLAELNKDYTRE